MLMLANEMVCVGVFVFLGALGFVLLMLGMTLRVIRMAWLALFGGDGQQATANQRIRCANPACGELNWSHVRFCKRCGNPLQQALGGERYG